MATLFASDLHLSTERPAISEVFFRFLDGAASKADALYILGDLFEYWLGDDDITDPLNVAVTNALRGLSEKGTKLFFMHGNRDLLLGGNLPPLQRAMSRSDPDRAPWCPTLLSMASCALTTSITRHSALRAQLQQRIPRSRCPRVTDVGCATERAQQQARLAEIMDVSTRRSNNVREHCYPR